MAFHKRGEASGGQGGNRRKWWPHENVSIKVIAWSGVGHFWTGIHLENLRRCPVCNVSKENGINKHI